MSEDIKEFTFPPLQLVLGVGSVSLFHQQKIIGCISALSKWGSQSS